MSETTPCAGSGCWADGAFFDFKATCPGCYQPTHVRPDGGGSIA